MSVGDNYGDDTNDGGDVDVDDVEIRKLCLGLKGCKDVKGNWELYTYLCH